MVFTEDSAAILGLAIATTSLLLTWYTGNPMWDALGSVAIGSVLVVVAILLAVEIKSLIIGEASTTDYTPYIENRMKTLIPGGKVLHLIAVQIGSNEVMLSVKISTGEIKEVKKLIEAINLLELDLKKEFPEIVWRFIEPDFE